MDVRQQKYARQLRRVRALAESMTLEYLERLQKIIADTAATDMELMTINGKSGRDNGLLLPLPP